MNYAKTVARYARAATSLVQIAVAASLLAYLLGAESGPGAIMNTRSDVLTPLRATSLRSNFAGSVAVDSRNSSPTESGPGAI